MSKPMTPRQWKRAMKKFKVDAHYYSGWKHRGRPAYLGWGDVHAVLIHHTGSDGGDSASYNAFLFRNGRPGIPGPLCHATCDADGDVHIGAVGRANHAGRGSGRVYRHVLREDYEGYRHELSPGPDTMDCNAVYYGLEVKYDGSHPMADRQYEQAVRFAAAICDHYGWTALSVIGHKESTSRKWDPGDCNMATFRRDVRDMLAGTNDTDPDPLEEIMSWYKNKDEFEEAIAERVWNHQIEVAPELSKKGNRKHQAKNVLRYAEKCAAAAAGVIKG